jgi:hypothetical protein
MRIAYTLRMSAIETEAAIGRWHDAVNNKDLTAALGAVTNPVVINGPKGAGPITDKAFVEWITRSGITLRPRSYHPITDRVIVVEQDAQWTADAQPTQLATLFRATGDQVSAALRFPALREALEFAYLYTELAATE